MPPDITNHVMEEAERIAKKAQLRTKGPKEDVFFCLVF